MFKAIFLQAGAGAMHIATARSAEVEAAMWIQGPSVSGDIGNCLCNQNDNNSYAYSQKSITLCNPFLLQFNDPATKLIFNVLQLHSIKMMLIVEMT